MARLAGHAGDVYIAAAQVAGIKEWSLDYAATALDSSGFDGGQAKEFIIGQTEWSGSFDGFKDGAPLAIGSSVSAEFQESATVTQKWTGTVYITDITPGTAVDGIVTYGYSFQGTGALTPPAA